ncbi:MAG: hypothetical protein ABII26_07445 [Pseudomonadota bacterium]
MAIEPFEKRFGMIAMGKGFITLGELFAALKVQVNEEIEEGRHRLIGEIMLEQGFITSEQIQEVVKSIL